AEHDLGRLLTQLGVEPLRRRLAQLAGAPAVGAAPLREFGAVLVGPEAWRDRRDPRVGEGAVAGAPDGPAIAVHGVGRLEPRRWEGPPAGPVAAARRRAARLRPRCPVLRSALQRREERRSLAAPESQLRQDRLSPGVEADGPHPLAPPPVALPRRLM